MAPFTTIFAEDTYEVPIFHNTGPIVDMHYSSRGGHSNNLTELLAEKLKDESINRDYLNGILFGSILMWCILIVWSGLLILFVCLGDKRVGFFSGKPPKRPMPPPGMEIMRDSSPFSYLFGSKNIKRSGQYDLEGERIQVGENVTPESATCDVTNDGGALLQQDVLQNIETSGEMFESASSAAIVDDEKAENATDMVSVKQNDETDGNKISSHSNTKNAVDDNYALALVAYEKKRAKFNTILLVCRSVVIISCVCIFAASITFIVKGFNSINQSVQNGLDALDGVRALANKGIDIIDTYEEQQGAVIGEVKLMLQNETYFCPGLVDDITELCKTTDGSIGEGISAAGGDGVGCLLLEVQQLINAFTNSWRELNSAIFHEATKLREDLVKLLDTVDSIEGTANSFSWSFYVALVFVLVLDIVVFFIGLGVYLAWKGELTFRYRCFRSTFLVPLFLFNTFFHWVFASLFVIGSIVSSDFCYNSPDENIDLIVKNNKSEFSSLLFLMIQHWLGGCVEAAKDTVAFSLTESFEIVVSLILIVHRIITKITLANPQALSEYCGVDVSPFIAFATALDGTFHSYLWAIESTRELFFCENWRPIYDIFLYEAICYNGVTGLAWVFSSFITIGFFSMVILTLRFTMRTIHDEDDPENSSFKKESQRRDACSRETPIEQAE